MEGEKHPPGCSVRNTVVLVHPDAQRPVHRSFAVASVAPAPAGFLPHVCVRNARGAADGRPAEPLKVLRLAYQVPLTQPPMMPVGGVHVRVVAPLVRVIENVSPLVELAVTV